MSKVKAHLTPSTLSDFVPPPADWRPAPSPPGHLDGLKPLVDPVDGSVWWVPA